MSKIILITGASGGFGKIWTEAFLQQGYKVAATVRNVASLNELVAKYGDAILPVQLNVTDREASFAAVQKVQQHFGKIDVLINNAGYSLTGAVEEATEQDARDQFETNFFGYLWLTQAVLPIMRGQKSGHIIQVSSVLGLATLPTLGLYNASKFAIEGLSETLASEVEGFGIKVTLIEPNGYASNIWKSEFNSPRIDAYDEVKNAFSQVATSDSFGKIEATTTAILKLVDAENPPLRLLLGKVALPFIRQNYQERMAVWEEWAAVSENAHGH